MLLLTMSPKKTPAKSFLRGRQMNYRSLFAITFAFLNYPVLAALVSDPAQDLPLD